MLIWYTEIIDQKGTEILTESENIIQYLDMNYGNGELIRQSAKYAFTNENPKGIHFL